MKLFAEWLADLAFWAASSAAGVASDWNMYQPKEPAKLKMMRK